MAQFGYILTPGAVDDIRDIGDWSLSRWGKEKTFEYLEELHAGLEYLGANYKTFEKSETRSNLSGGTGLSLYPVNQHYIVYLPIDEKTIAVAAVIRKGRDVAAILQKDSFAIRRSVEEIREQLAQGLIRLPD